MASQKLTKKLSMTKEAQSRNTISVLLGLLIGSLAIIAIFLLGLNKDLSVLGLFALTFIIACLEIKRGKIYGKTFLVSVFFGVVLGFIIANLMWIIIVANANRHTVLYNNDHAEKFMDKCNTFCETKDYWGYCTDTLKDITKSINWNHDNQSGRLIGDKNLVWNFCEDRIYCFLVTNCSEMDIEGCRSYTCQQYTKKYNSTEKATLKMKEIYKASDNLTECYREDNIQGRRYFDDFSSEENWLYVGFVSKGWCSETYIEPQE